MSAWNLVWFDEAIWESTRQQLGSQAAEEQLGAAVASVLAFPPRTHPGIGTLTRGVPPDGLDASFAFTLAASRPQTLMWSQGVLTLDSAAPSTVELAEMGPTGAGGRWALIVLVDADLSPSSQSTPLLGSALYELLDHPSRVTPDRTHINIRRGLRVSLDEEAYLVWLSGAVRDPRTLTPPERSQLAQAPRARGVSAESARADGTGYLAGFLLNGPAYEETYILAGPAGVSVLMGRNGAGKSLTLNVISGALAGLREFVQVNGRPTNDAHPPCSVLLDYSDQCLSPRLFSALFAEIGWSPMSQLSEEARRQCSEHIPAWSSFHPRPADATGLTVAELANQPLDLLRDTLAEALAAAQPGGPSEDTRLLAGFIVSSPTVAVAQDWSLSLVGIPERATPAIVAAAQRFIDSVPVVASDGFSGLQYRFFQLAQRIVGDEEGVPVSVLGVQLAHAVEPIVDVHPESGWSQLSKAVASAVQRDIPVPLMFAPDRSDVPSPEGYCEEAVLEVMAALLLSPDDGAWLPDGQHPFAMYPEHAQRQTQLLQDRTNELLPTFVLQDGRVSIDLADTGEWHHRRVRLTFTQVTGGSVLIGQLPSGYRTWVMASVKFARSQLLSAHWQATHVLFGEFKYVPGESQVDFGRVSVRKDAAFRDAAPESVLPEIQRGAGLLYLLDEPEAHLHLTAQRDVVERAVSLAEMGQGSIVATHSLEFLNVAAGRARIYTLTPGPPKIRTSSWTGLRDLTEHAEELGLPPSAVALACRAVLVVEGRNDREVMLRYCGTDLDRARVIIVVLQGSYGVPSIAELEFLHTLRIPIFVLLDHVRRGVLADALAGKQVRLHGEEQVLRTLHHALKDRRLSVYSLPFSEPDIVAAIPDTDIARALSQLGAVDFIGWKLLHERAESAYRSKKRRFKDTFQDNTGETVENVLKKLLSTDPTASRSPALERLVAIMLESLDSSARGGELGVKVLP